MTLTSIAVAAGAAALLAMLITSDARACSYSTMKYRLRLVELTEDGQPADPTDWYGLRVGLSLETSSTVYLFVNRDTKRLHTEWFRAR